MDIGAITALAYLSGGGFSQARVAYALVPITLAFRFRPTLTAVGGAVVVVAYLAQALSHPSPSGVDARRYIAVQAGYLIWIAAAAALLSLALARRTRRMGELALQARHLLTDAMGAEERERQASPRRSTTARCRISCPSATISRRSTRPSTTPHSSERNRPSRYGRQLREIVSDLHPLVLEQAGLEAAISAVAAQAAQRGGFTVHVAYESTPRPTQERVLLAAARELLTNVAKHARARNVDVRCVERGGAIELERQRRRGGVRHLGDRRARRAGHIGLASQRARIEGAEGR